jgi:hypothetical protein
VAWNCELPADHHDESPTALIEQTSCRFFELECWDPSGDYDNEVTQDNGRIAPKSTLEEALSATLRRKYSGQCACCGEPLVSNSVGVVAWRVGSRFVCNEFCADGISNDHVILATADRIDTVGLLSFN